MPKIQLITTDGTELEFEIPSSPVRFGRIEENEIVIPDASVSSRHGEISAHGDSVEIVDKGSTNGTFIGGQRVESGVVNPGESFRIGSVNGLVIGEPASAHEEHESSAPEAADDKHQWSPVSSGAAITGLGASPCPTNLRQGFGPKAKVKNTMGTLMTLLGVVALGVCGYAIFTISHMAAAS